MHLILNNEDLIGFGFKSDGFTALEESFQDAISLRYPQRIIRMYRNLPITLEPGTWGEWRYVFPRSLILVARCLERTQYQGDPGPPRNPARPVSEG